MELKPVTQDALSDAYKNAKSKPPITTITQNRLIIIGSATGLRGYEIDGVVDAFRVQKFDVTWEIIIPSYGGVIKSNGVTCAPEFKSAEIRFYHTQSNTSKQSDSKLIAVSLFLNFLLIVLGTAAYFILLRN
jgi:hypothetical protein